MKIVLLAIFLGGCSIGSQSQKFRTFSPLCFKRPQLHGNQTSYSGDAIAYNISFPKFKSVQWDYEYFIQPSCQVDIYGYGLFYAFEMFIEMIKIDCKCLNNPLAKISGVVVKTGNKPKPKDAPPLNPEWWQKGTIVKLTVKPVISYHPTSYFCTIRHLLLPSDGFPGANVNFTIDIRGCPEGVYGKHCNKTCACQNGGTCHPLDGSCLCSKQWTGRFCQTWYPHLEVHGTTKALHVGDQAHMACHVYAVNMTRNSPNSLGWVYTPQDGTKNQSIPGDALLQITGRQSRNLSIANFNDGMAGTYTCKFTTKDQKFQASWTIVSKGCVTNRYGPQCEHACDCQNSATCDRIEGCVCSQQFMGSKCQMTTTLLGVIIGLCFVGLIIIPSAILVGKHVYTVWKRMKAIAIIRDEQLQYQASKGNPWTDVLPEISEGTPEDQLHEKWGIPDEDVYIGKNIAEGAFAEVYKGHMIRKEKTYEVAIKMLKDDKNRQSVTDFFQEFKTLAEIYHHRHILQMLGIGKKVVAGQCKQIIIMEYMAKGSLLDVLRKSRPLGLMADPYASGGLAKGQLTSFAMDILNALAYLEFKKIIHRDVAARNMLVSSCMVVKLADFGFSRDVRTDGVYRLKDVEKKLPWKWMAYESLTDQVWTPKSDVWSFGILLWEIVTLGGAPYPAVSGPDRLLRMLGQGYRMEKPEHCSQEWYDIMKVCWDLVLEQRPTFAKLRSSFEKLKKNTFTHPELSHYHEEHFTIDHEAVDDDVEDGGGLVRVNYPGIDDNHVPRYVNSMDSEHQLEINEGFDEDNQSLNSVDSDSLLLPHHGDEHKEETYSVGRKKFQWFTS